jgi:hypothetical protein
MKGKILKLRLRFGRRRLLIQVAETGLTKALLEFDEEEEHPDENQVHRLDGSLSKERIKEFKAKEGLGTWSDADGQPVDAESQRAAVARVARRISASLLKVRFLLCLGQRKKKMKETRTEE